LIEKIADLERDAKAVNGERVKLFMIRLPGDPVKSLGVYTTPEAAKTLQRHFTGLENERDGLKADFDNAWKEHGVAVERMKTAEQERDEARAALEKHGDAWAVVYREVSCALDADGRLSGDALAKLAAMWEANSSLARQASNAGRKIAAVPVGLDANTGEMILEQVTVMERAEWQELLRTAKELSKIYDGRDGVIRDFLSAVGALGEDEEVEVEVEELDEEEECRKAGEKAVIGAAIEWRKWWGDTEGEAAPLEDALAFAVDRIDSGDEVDEGSADQLAPLARVVEAARDVHHAHACFRATDYSVAGGPNLKHNREEANKTLYGSVEALCEAVERLGE
jgi:hypothetical protein